MLHNQGKKLRMRALTRNRLPETARAPRDISEEDRYGFTIFCCRLGNNYDVIRSEETLPLPDTKFVFHSVYSVKLVIKPLSHG